MKQSHPIPAAGEARRCVCRGYLVADPADADSVERTVQEHARTVRHQTWAAGAQLRGELVARQDVTIGGATYPRTTVRRVA